MKNKIMYLSALALVLSFASCKKDRTCECTYTSVSGSTSHVVTEKITIKKIKKSEAKSLCQKTTYTSNNAASNSISTTTNDCKLTK